MTRTTTKVLNMKCTSTELYLEQLVECLKNVWLLLMKQETSPNTGSVIPGCTTDLCLRQR
jgi:hypothetical protein